MQSTKHHCMCAVVLSCAVTLLPWRCWHNYGLKWVRTWVEPEEQDLYYSHFNTGIYRAAEVVREQIIDTAVDEAGDEVSLYLKFLYFPFDILYFAHFISFLFNSLHFYNLNN